MKNGIKEEFIIILVTENHEGILSKKSDIDIKT
jgi:hypothetical protein